MEPTVRHLAGIDNRTGHIGQSTVRDQIATGILWTPRTNGRPERAICFGDPIDKILPGPQDLL